MANDKKKEEKDEVDAALSLALWNSLTNMMCWVMFRSILEMHGDHAAAEAIVDKMISEWRSTLMRDVNLKINEVSSLRQAIPGDLGALFGSLLPDEEETRVKFSKSLKAVEKMAKQMLLSKKNPEE